MQTEGIANHATHMGQEPNEKKHPIQSSSALVGVGSLCVAEDLDSY